MTATFDREAVNDAMAEGRHECGQCGLWFDEADMQPLTDRHGTWWRCNDCRERTNAAWAAEDSAEARWKEAAYQ